MTIIEYVCSDEFRRDANEATEALRRLGGRGTIEAQFQMVDGRLEGCKWIMQPSKRVVYSAPFASARSLG